VRGKTISTDTCIQYIEVLIVLRQAHVRIDERVDRQTHGHTNNKTVGERETHIKKFA
jgi:hypothetical protein